MQLAIFRHGSTQWNEEGRYQGHSDIPLSDKGREYIRSLKYPNEFKNYRVISSHLKRASESAEILTGQTPEIEPRVMEMSLGEWEGRLVKEVRAQLNWDVLGEGYTGLDHSLPNGETLRQVQMRLNAWLKDIYVAQKNVFAISHKGTMTALYALATGWQATSKPEHKLDWSCVHEYEITAPGQIKLVNLKRSLK